MEYTDEELERIDRAYTLWEEAGDPRGTDAAAYLASRSLDLTDDICGTVLRVHHHCPWRDENTGKTIRIQALLAAFRSIADDKITAVHRVRLDRPQIWPKTDRRMLGVIGRAAIKLDPLAGDQLVVGEGIETCLAARQHFDYRPVWAVGSVGAISGLPILSRVRQLTILQETGAPSADAVRFCGTRWRREGKRVRAVLPDMGSDLNDEIMLRRAAHG